ncbi:hypothetical protein [Streptomyces agglomeratus]|uniref:hypothetical protein n=1 Tax=Streptomyces agglomeratus TaxID=285458 RepID=UPI00159EF9AD|nr:hypothetical protein [Streptomyces agglomeratus]
MRTTLAERASKDEGPSSELFRAAASSPAYRFLGIASDGDFLAASLVGSAARLA